ncbi:sulfite exporter TauE/SafE family protein [Ulvibacterium sp.]|uniref:sulfite exporter TauE/SafE family protein n=1 Tax=Ulvibacterium sp. TaxID=2665914 RepID=UPI00262100D9|nr:sulfite exporter TauE/SafE family protein [Ulvibacterium sp.]
MLLSAESLVLLCLGFFLVATLYSSVGFGGGSSYLALLTLFFASFFAIRSLALVCNLVVVSGSMYLYYKKGHIRLSKFIPFVITSIPMAFLGASFRLKEQVFFIILGCSLIVSAIFLAWQTYTFIADTDRIKKYPGYFDYFIGAAIGFLSGLVGIGGGIFLAPVLNHMRWDVPIKIAALASFFILVNSVSGIGGLMVAHTLELPLKETFILAGTVFLGGQLGIRISLRKMSANGIKRVTALLVFIVGIRVLLKNGLELI